MGKIDNQKKKNSSYSPANQQRSTPIVNKSGYLRLRAQIEKNEGEVRQTRNERDLLESRTNIHTRK
jgi:hypothetical protein